MKKTLALLSSFICILSFSACGEKVSDSSSKSIADVSESEVNEQETISESESETNEDSALENTDGKTLVVYYSASGNTEEVAQYIADETNGDSACRRVFFCRFGLDRRKQPCLSGISKS